MGMRLAPCSLGPGGGRHERQEIHFSMSTALSYEQEQRWYCALMMVILTANHWRQSHE